MDYKYVDRLDRLISRVIQLRMHFGVNERGDKGSESVILLS